MKKTRIKKIVDQWVFPTESGSYMGGLEKRPVLEKSGGVVVTDTEGKEYLDFQSGQMGAALGHQHPRMMAAIEKTLKSMMHASNALLHVPRLKLHETLGKLLPKPLKKSLFLVSGSDSIEASIDLARKATGGLDVVGLKADVVETRASAIEVALHGAFAVQGMDQLDPGAGNGKEGRGGLSRWHILGAGQLQPHVLGKPPNRPIEIRYGNGDVVESGDHGTSSKAGLSRNAPGLLWLTRVCYL